MFKKIATIALLLPSLVMAEPLDSVVAVVNDGVITTNELKAQVELMRKQITMSGVNIPTDVALRKQVLQHLIDVDLQLQLAKQNNITVDSDELDAAIANIAKGNHLTIDELRAELSKQGLAWKTYRANIQKEMIISRVQQKAVAQDMTVTPQQVDNFLKSPKLHDYSKFTYHLQNIVIPLPEEPSPKQLNQAKQKAQALLEKIRQGANFNELAIMESSGEFALEGGDLGERHLAELPEIFAKEVVSMKKGQVIGPIRAANGFQLLKLVNIGGADFNHQVVKSHVRHILLKQDTSMTPEEIKKQADNLYQQLTAGKDFAQMAKQYSVDSSSAVKGGDLDWVTGDELVPEFTKAMNKLAIKQISRPVRTIYGWHLIQVLERKHIDDSDSYQRQQIKMQLQQKKFTEAVQNWLQHIRSDAYIKIMDKALA